MNVVFHCRNPVASKRRTVKQYNLLISETSQSEVVKNRGSPSKFDK